MWLYLHGVLRRDPTLPMTNVFRSTPPLPTPHGSNVCSVCRDQHLPVERTQVSR